MNELNRVIKASVTSCSRWRKKLSAIDPGSVYLDIRTEPKEIQHTDAKFGSCTLCFHYGCREGGGTDRRFRIFPPPTPWHWPPTTASNGVCDQFYWHFVNCASIGFLGDADESSGDSPWKTPESDGMHSTLLRYLPCKPVVELVYLAYFLTCWKFAPVPKAGKNRKFLTSY